MLSCDRAWAKVIQSDQDRSASMGFALAARVRYNELAVSQCGGMRCFGLDGDNL